MRSDWTLPICTGAERLKDAMAASCIRRKSPRRCCIASCWRRPSRAKSSSIRSSAPAPPARPPSGSGATISASNATPLMPTLPARGSRRSSPPRVEDTGPTREEQGRAAHAVRPRRRARAGAPRRAPVFAEDGKRERRWCARTAAPGGEVISPARSTASGRDVAPGRRHATAGRSGISRSRRRGSAPIDLLRAEVRRTLMPAAA